MDDMLGLSPISLTRKLALNSRDLSIASIIALQIHKNVGIEIKASMRGFSLDNLARNLSSKVASSINRGGGRVYSRYSYTTNDDKSVAVVKFRVAGVPPFRIVTVIGDTVKGRGILKPVRIKAYGIEYLAVPKSMHSRFDIVKPRIKRVQPANGLVMAASYSLEGESPKPVVMDCYGASGILREYRSKYIVFIPPIIAWRFSRWIQFDARYTYDLDWCKEVEAEITS